MKFFVAAIPGVKGNSKRVVKKGGRPSLIGDPLARKRERELVALLAEFRPSAPLDGPLRLDVTFVMPIPSSFPKWKRAAALAGDVYPTRRPDRGNILKLVEDAMEGVFYRDDAQIVRGEVRKAYGDAPGYLIELEQLHETTFARGAPAPRAPRRPGRGGGALMRVKVGDRRREVIHEILHGGRGRRKT